MVDESKPTAAAGRFQALWNRCLPIEKDADPIYDDLVSRYNELGRCYHKQTHLAHCLQEFDKAFLLMECPDAVELALWFHDAIYVPGATDNELRSAELFSHWGGICFTSDFVDKICKLILITRHKQAPTGSDECYIVDIDLSSFGVNWPHFLQDSENVRKELAFVPDATYYPAHAGFLNLLLNRPRIFYTDFFYALYEEAARCNIKRLLSSTDYANQP